MATNLDRQGRRQTGRGEAPQPVKPKLRVYTVVCGNASSVRCRYKPGTAGRDCRTCRSSGERRPNLWVLTEVVGQLAGE